MTFEVHSIGRIITPYHERAPYQPVADEGSSFWLEVDEEYARGLEGLATFNYIYVLFYAHQSRDFSLTVTPPWAGGKSTGIFSSRSPKRPNPLVLSVVKLLRVEGNRVYISGIDAFNGSPLLDIKPYIKDLDSKDDSNYGWIDLTGDDEHFKLHLKGIPHDY